MSYERREYLEAAEAYVKEGNFEAVGDLIEAGVIEPEELGLDPHSAEAQTLKTVNEASEKNEDWLKARQLAREHLHSQEEIRFIVSAALEYDDVRLAEVALRYVNRLDTPKSAKREIRAGLKLVARKP